ncbi:MAG: His/Gly/Thr/Pro-type tRNA ligase C-terminal domain-containing protein [Candidatus Daviesbacteria bacterium]|nr:His/Gly/Thr/Pro-type tRNA ligase C-terminal domain-containing protein [Candidatus Daviesbacteria bacterium]
MKYSKLFSKTLRQPPKEAETINHKLLTQAGFVDQLMAGVYSYLPLGLRVLNKIEQIVREEMDAVEGQEVLMPILHPKSIWETTGGWGKIDVLFKINSRTEKEYALGQSEEEVVTPLVMSRVNTYKDLPLSVYQIHWKFRDELRAKSGILRGREFYMKDMYSFHETQEDFLKYYETVKKSYLKIYEKLGLTAKVTEASGGSFSEKISYEFMVLTDAGEDDILYCSDCDFCVNVEIAKMKVGDPCPRCGGKLDQAKASEVGNVFDLGQKYGKDFNLSFLDREGKKSFPIMGCYGLGISRVMGVIVEKFNDEKGIIWPESVAPFKIHLIGLDQSEENIKSEAEKVYKQLQTEGIEVLFDDRVDVSAGEKFATADLVGIPYRIVISKKTEGKLEVKKRNEKTTEFMSLEDLLKLLAKS